MSDEDDDLPVLTQVLRTGSGHVPPFVHDEALSGAAMDTRGASEGQRALVIGSDPDPLDDEPFEPDDRWSAQALTALLADDGEPPTVHAFASPPAPTDPRRIDVRHNDVFLRTAPTDAAFGDRIDEPPLDVASIDHGGRVTSSHGNGRDVSLVFRDQFSTTSRDPDATFAARVRDSVLQELSGRIDTELDARIAQTLHAELETALAQLQTTLRVELGEALRDVVGHAVDDAIRRLRDPSTPHDLG